MDLQALAELEMELTSLLPLNLQDGQDEAARTQQLGEQDGLVQDVVIVCSPNSGHTVFVYPDLEADTPPATPGLAAQPAAASATPAVVPKRKQKPASPSSSGNISPERADESSQRRKHKSHRKRRVVVSPRTRHSKSARGGAIHRKSRKSGTSSSSFAATSSASSDATPSPPHTKKRRASGRKLPPNCGSQHVGEEAQGAAGGGGSTVARFQCRVCGMTRFLALSAGLPARACECGSSAVSVVSWVRVAPGPDRGLMGGGLGRECVRCSRCHRLYSSDAHLRRHRCKRQRPKSVLLSPPGNVVPDVGLPGAAAAADVAAGDWLGVREVPTCPHCAETFIFETLLERHLRREHRDPLPL